MASSNSFDSILAAGSAYANLVHPVNNTKASSSSDEELKALMELGYRIGAERDALGREEALQFGSSLPDNLTPEQLEAVSQGLIQYQADASSMNEAGAIDHLQSFLGGGAEGFVGTFTNLGAMGTGSLMDTGIGYYNKARELLGLPTYAHNFLGEATKLSNSINEGIGNLIANNEEELLVKADAARRAAREVALEKQYQRDLTNGMGESEAGFRDFLRGIASGINNFTDSPTTAIRTTGNAAGQIGAQALMALATRGRSVTEQAGTKVAVAAAEQAAKSALGRRFLDAGILGITEAAGSIGDASKEIDRLSDDQLFKQSPTFRELYQDNLIQGKSQEQAAKDARTDLKREAAMIEAGVGGVSALLAGAATRPLEGLGSIGTITDFGKGVVSEGVEEGLTGLGQGIGSNIAAQATYDPNQRLTEGVGAQVGEGAIGGALAAGALRTPGTAVGLAQDAYGMSKQGIDRASTYIATEKAAAQQAKVDKANAAIDEAEQEASSEPVKKTTSTIETPSDLDPNESNPITITEETDANGKTVYKANDPDIDNVSKLSAQEIKDLDIKDEEGKPVESYSRFKALGDLSKKATSKEATTEDKQKFISFYDNYLDKLDKTQQFEDALLEQKGVDKSGETATKLRNAIRAGLVVDGVDGLYDKGTSEYSVFDAASRFKKQYDSIKEQLSKDASKTVEAINPENTTTNDIKAVNTAIADDNLDIKDKKVQNIILHLKKKSKDALKDEEKQLLAIDKIVDTIEQSSTFRLHTEGGATVKTSLYGAAGKADTGSYRSVRNLSKELYSAVARNDSKAVKAALNRFGKIAEFKANKLNALNRALKQNTTDPQDYWTYASVDLEGYTAKVSLRNLDFYDQVKAEAKDAQKVLKSFNSIIREYKPDFKLPKLPQIKPLQNEQELRDRFTRTYGNAKQRAEQPETSPTSTQSDTEVETDTTTPFQESAQIEPSTSVSEALQNQEEETTPFSQDIPEVRPSVTQNQEVESSPTVDEVSEPEVETTAPQNQEIEETNTEESSLGSNEDTGSVEETKPEVTEEPKVEETKPTEEDKTEPEVKEEPKVEPKQEAKTESKPEVKEEPKPQEKKTQPKQETKKVEDDGDDHQTPMFDNFKDLGRYLKKTKKERKLERLARKAQKRKERKEQLEKTKRFTAEDVEAPEIQKEGFHFNRKLEEKYGGIAGFYQAAQTLESEAQIRANKANKGKSKKKKKKISEPERLYQLALRAEERRKYLRDHDDADVRTGLAVQEQIDAGKGGAAGYFNTATEKVSMKEVGDKLKSVTSTPTEDNDFNTQMQGIRNIIFNQSRNKSPIDLLSGVEMERYVNQKLSSFVKDTEDSLAQEELSLSELWDRMDEEERRRKREEEGEDLSFGVDIDNVKQQELDMRKVDYFVKEFTTRIHYILTKDGTDGSGGLNLESFIKDSIKSGKSAGYTALGITQNADGTLDFSKASPDRLLTLFTETDREGRFRFNGKVATALAYAVFQVLQNQELRFGVRSNAQIDTFLESAGLDSSIMETLTPLEESAVRSGETINSVIDAIASKFSDYAGISNNPEISNTISGTTAIKQLAAVAYQMMESMGYLHTDILYYQAIRNEDGTFYYRRIHPQQGKPINTADPNVRTVVLSTNTQAYRLNEKLNEKQIEAQSVSPLAFKTVSMIDAIDTILSHQPERTFYYSPSEMPPVTQHQLRSDVPITEEQRISIANQRQTPHVVDPEYFAALRYIGMEGVFDLYSFDRSMVSGTVQTLASIEGQRQSVARNYITTMQMINAAINHNPNFPAIYGDHSIHRGGRSQELTPNGDQASKIARYGLSNVVSNISLKNPNDMEGFKRAFLQAFGVKIRNKTVEQIEDLFAKVEDALTNKYTPEQIQNRSMIYGSKRILSAWKTIEDVLGDPPENPPIGLNALINMMRYLEAKQGNFEEFTNTLPIELDGSCNGFAMSHLLLDGELVISHKHLLSLVLSNIYVGMDDVNSASMAQVLKSDNYTANADAATEEVGKVVQSVIDISQSDDPQVNPRMDAGTLGEVSDRALFQATYSLINRVAQGSVDINEQALDSAFLREADKGIDGDAELLSISRKAIKYPTVRINYGQGQSTNAREIWGDFSTALSDKLSEIIRGVKNKVPPYKTFFAKELASGKMTEDQAYQAYVEIGKNLKLLNSYSIKESKDGEAREIERFKSQHLDQFLSIFSLKKDKLPDKELIELVSKWHLMDPAHYTRGLLNNIGKYYADPLYKAVDNSRTSAFTGFTKSLVGLSGAISMMAYYNVNDKIKEYMAMYNGMLPSDTEIRKFKEEAAKKFPTVISMPLMNLSIAGTKSIDVTSGNKSSRMDSRRLSKGKVKDGIFKGNGVISSIHYGLTERLPYKNGVGPVATTVIAAGDGAMQVKIFNNKERHYSAVNRYDGVDMDPKEYKKGSQYINQAVHELQNYLPMEAIAKNGKQFYEYVKNTYSQREINNLHKSLLEGDMAYRPWLQSHKFDVDEANQDVMLRYLREELLYPLEAYRKNAFLNAIARMSMPVTVAHMSVGEDAYHWRDPRDTFGTPSEMPWQQRMAISQREMQRRKGIAAKYEDELYAEFEKTGTLPKPPEEIYTSEPISKLGTPYEAPKTEPEVLVERAPETFTREIPNSRTNESREVKAKAPLESAPRETVQVQPTKTVIDKKGRASKQFRRYLDSFFDHALEGKYIKHKDLVRENLTKMVMNLIPLDVEIKKVTPKDPIYSEVDFNSSLAVYVPGLKTIYVSGSSTNANERREAMVHEMIHAVVASKIFDATGKEGSMEYYQVLNLDKLCTRFANHLESVAPAVYQDFKSRVLDSADMSFNSLGVRVNEFVAYMLSNPELMEFNTNTKGNTGIYTSTLLKIKNWFISTIKKLFNLNTQEEFDFFRSAYGEVLVTTSAIALNDLAQTNSDISDEVLSFTRKDPNLSVQQWGARVRSLTNSLALKEKNPGLFKADRELSARKIAQRLDEEFSHSLFPMTEQQRAVAASLAMVYSSAYALDSSVKLDAKTLRDLALEKLKPEHFVLPSDGSDSMKSQLRYDFFTGKDALSHQDENMSLGIFMAMAAVSPEFRAVLKKTNLMLKLNDLGVNKVVDVSDSDIDEFLNNAGFKALEVINNPSLSKQQRKEITDVIDQLNYNLTQTDKQASSLAKNIAALSGLLTSADEWVANKKDEVLTSFLDGKTLKAMMKSDKALVQKIANALRITIPELLQQDSVFFDTHKKDVLQLVNSYAAKNTGFFSRFAMTAYRELFSTDGNADAVYGMEKKAKASIQALRSTWREMAPRELKQKFREEGVALDEESAVALNNTILTADLGVFDQATIKQIMTNGLSSAINQRTKGLSSKTLQQAQDLAQYMTTGKATSGMLRNAKAIALHIQRDVSKVDQIDQLVSLLALKNQVKDFNKAREIFKKAPKAFNYTVDQQRQLRTAEVEKASLPTQFNQYKGYYPQDTITKTNVQVVPKESIGYYKSLGYKVKGYTTDNRHAYMQSSLNPMSTFNQGGLQAVINQAGGIDQTSGFSPNSKVYKRVMTKDAAKIIEAAKDRDTKGEAYIPILDTTGSKIIGYEVTVDPQYYQAVHKQTDFSNNIGAWKGRQIEESMAEDLNRELVNTLQQQYENAKGTKEESQFVDLISLARKDPVIRDALSNLSPKTLKLLNNGKASMPNHFFVRADLVPDVIGRRQASIIDMKTGISYWSKSAQRNFCKVAESVMGKRAMAYLYRGESLLRSTASSIRNFIVIRSGEVMFNNLIGNAISLTMRGVPITDIIRLTPKIVKELEHYNASRKKQVRLQMELNAEMGKDKPSEYRIKQLQAKLDEEKGVINQLTYSKDLIEAGEYNTIADLGDLNDDILLSTGKWGEYLEKKVKGLPKVLKEGGRQLILSKDTALYRALEKGTMYGDFVAKAILCEHLKKKGVDPSKALSKARYEFVNYDMLPGRSREYLENIGLLWFYNYKLRIARTAMSMIRENPLMTLLSLFSPISLGIGTPISDNFLVKLFSNPFGSVGFKIFDLPWLTNHLWYNLFS